MTEYLGEVLFRQGWWVRKFDNSIDAAQWSMRQAGLEKNTANPPRDIRIRELILPDTDPQAPDILFDDYF